MSDLKIVTWVKRHKIIAIAAYVICILLFLEASIHVVARYGLVRIVQFPTSSQQDRFLGDISPVFGVWHYPNRSIMQQSPCFNVSYVSNAFGARDRERTHASSALTRVAVLGDSFVEGYGVERADRMTDLAELSTGDEFLNFGVSGNFGSIQEWLLYKDLASKFDHSQVVISLLPANDFVDNDPENFPADRYRPYLKGTTSENFEVYYSTTFEKRFQPPTMKLSRMIRRQLYNLSYIANIVRQFGDYLQTSKITDAYNDISAKVTSSFYDSYTPIDMERTLYSFRKIIELAGDRPVIILVIPRLLDLEVMQEKGYNFKLIDRLKSFAVDHPSVQVLDLLPVFMSYSLKHNISIHDFFQTCDGHWSKLGNKIAADALVGAVQKS